MYLAALAKMEVTFDALYQLLIDNYVAGRYDAGG